MVLSSKGVGPPPPGFHLTQTLSVTLSSSLGVHRAIHLPKRNLSMKTLTLLRLCEPKLTSALVSHRLAAPKGFRICPGDGPEGLRLELGLGLGVRFLVGFMVA